MVKNTIITVVIASIVGAVVAFVAVPDRETVKEIVREVKVGALASPDIPSPYLAWGGLRTYQYNVSMGSATTTVCALVSPASTSTLQYAGIKVTVSTTTASIWTLAKATTAYATTTSLGKLYLAANASGAAVASTSPVAGANNIFAPSTYLVVGVQGGVGTFSPTGTCSASFVEM